MRKCLFFCIGRFFLFGSQHGATASIAAADILVRVREPRKKHISGYRGVGAPVRDKLMADSVVKAWE
jgi:hypothetical protein